MADRPLVLAHRGASRARPENTLAAFAKARELGADGVELDVRRTSDDRLVVHHDPHVERFGLIVEQPFAALRAAHPDIPTLVEALETCAGMIVNVEIKCLPWEPDADGADRRVLRAVAEMLLAGAPVPAADIIVTSFDIGAVDACRAIAPGLVTGWLTTGQELSAAAPVAAAHGHRWINPDRAAALRASAADVALVHDAGVRVNVWTVDEPGDIVALVANGFDGVITNVPDVALAALRELPPEKHRRSDGDVRGRRR